MSQLVTIYQKGTQTARAVIDPDDQSAQQCGIMREDNVTLTFSRADWINFQVGDYATIFGNYYQINTLFPFKKVGFGNYQYTLTMEAYMYDLGKTAYLFLNATNQFTEGKFSLRGKPVDFIQLIVYNLLRRDPGSAWKVGIVIDADYQTIDFDSQNCLQVLSTLGENFLTEYLIIGQTINLYQKQLVSGITLEYGQGKALYSVVRENQGASSGSNNANLITRLYAYGNNTNIGADYRLGAQYLRMAAGLYIEKNVAAYGIFEATVFFDGTNGLPDIYPQRTGIVSAVGDIYTFTDADIDFNVNDYLIGGVTAQLTFNTGQLAGYTFDIASFDNGTKTFIFNANTDEQTLTIPSDLLKAAVGDTYVLTNINMPLAYVNDAEAQLLIAAQAYLNLYGPPQVNYPVDCNPLYFKAKNIQLKLGYTYLLLDTATGINRQIRLVEFTRNIREPYKYSSLTLSDIVPVKSPIVKLYNSL